MARDRACYSGFLPQSSLSSSVAARPLRFQHILQFLITRAAFPDCPENTLPTSILSMKYVNMSPSIPKMCQLLVSEVIATAEVGGQVWIFSIAKSNRPTYRE